MVRTGVADKRAASESELHVDPAIWPTLVQGCSLGRSMWRHPTVGPSVNVERARRCLYEQRLARRDEDEPWRWA